MIRTTLAMIVYTAVKLILSILAMFRIHRGKTN